MEANNEPSFAHVMACEPMYCPDPAELPVPSVATEEAESEHSVLPVPVSDSEYEHTTCSVFTNMSVTPFISPLSVSESNDKLSPCSVSQSVSTVELSVSSTSIKNSGHVSFACVSIKSSVCPVLIKKSVIESFVCPDPINESEGELSTCPVPINGFDFERPDSPLSSNVFEVSVSPITINEPVICPLSPAMI